MCLLTWEHAVTEGSEGEENSHFVISKPQDFISQTISCASMGILLDYITMTSGYLLNEQFRCKSMERKGETNTINYYIILEYA